MVLSPSRHRVFNSVVSVSLPITVIEMIDKIAHECRLPRSEMIRQAIMEKFGSPESPSNSGADQEEQAS